MNCNWPESTLPACSTGEASKAPGHFTRPGYSFQMTSTATEPIKSIPPRRAAFAREYMTDNTSRAARDVGYMAKSASVEGSRLLANAELPALTTEQLRAGVRHLGQVSDV